MMWPVEQVKCFEGLYMKLLQISASIFLALMFFQNSIQAQSKGGRWQFENDGNDTASWDLIADDGTLQGAATFQPVPVPPQGSACLWLDSADVYDFFLVNDSDDLDFDNENIGISAWIHPIHINDVHYLVNKGLQDSNPKTTNYALRITTNGRLEFLMRDANNQAQRVTSSFTIPASVWSFVAAYYDVSAGKVYMWNNPELPPVDTLDFTQTIFSNNDPLAIGSWFRSDPLSPSTKDFDGGMDDVRISGRIDDILSPFTTISTRSNSASKDDRLSVELFPNPVRMDQKKIKIEIKGPISLTGPVNLVIYNILGQKVFENILHSSSQFQTFEWNLIDNRNRPVPAGLYFIRVDDPQKYQLRKIIIIR